MTANAQLKTINLHICKSIILSQWPPMGDYIITMMMFNTTTHYVLVKSSFKSPCYSYAVYCLYLISISLICAFDIFRFWSFIFIYPLPPPTPRPRVTGTKNFKTVASPYTCDFWLLGFYFEPIHHENLVFLGTVSQISPLFSLESFP